MNTIGNVYVAYNRCSRGAYRRQRRKHQNKKQKQNNEKRRLTTNPDITHIPPLLLQLQGGANARVAHDGVYLDVRAHGRHARLDALLDQAVAPRVQVLFSCVRRVGGEGGLDEGRDAERFWEVSGRWVGGSIGLVDA